MKFLQHSKTNIAPVHRVPSLWPAVLLISGLLFSAELFTGCGGATGGISTPTATATSLDLTTKAKVEANDRTGAEAMKAISKVEKHLHLNSDGTLALDVKSADSSSVPATRGLELTDEEVTTTQSLLAKLNAEVKAGQVQVNTDFSVSGSRSTQANQNGVTRYWWGFRIALDHGRTERLVAAMGVGAGTATIATFVGGDMVAAVLAIGAGVFSYFNSYGRGVYIYKPYFPSQAYWITAQP